jgi:mRNA interferase MazF
MSPFEVVLIKFPFANLENSKKRPALVLRQTRVTAKSSLVTIAMITSKVEGLELEGDYLLEDWVEAKLLHPSLVRLSKIATVDSELVEKKIGMLTLEDRKKVSKLFKVFFSSFSSS